MTAVSTVLGREAELGAINGFLTDPGSARALLLRGEPGIGKSTLWLASIALASERGYQIISTRPTEAEAKFSYVGLGDLLEGLRAEFLDDLPGPQRLALNATLLRADAPSEGLDHRTICVAVLASLRTIAASAPLLIAIDDVQWLDGPTALVLEFVARRLTDEPIRFIAALRAAAGVSDPVDLARTFGEGRVRTIDLIGTVRRFPEHALSATTRCDLPQADSQPPLRSFGRQRVLRPRDRPCADRWPLAA